MAEEGSLMSCPHLKEVVMLFCRAYPVKKMVPLDRLASVDPCLGGDFSQCPLFKDLSERLKACPDHAAVFEHVESRKGVQR
jgi:hypothetical protein